MDRASLGKGRVWELNPPGIASHSKAVTGQQVCMLSSLGAVTVRQAGIEPTLQRWEGCRLPLPHSRIASAWDWSLLIFCEHLRRNKGDPHRRRLRVIVATRNNSLRRRWLKSGHCCPSSVSPSRLPTRRTVDRHASSTRDFACHSLGRSPDHRYLRTVIVTMYSSTGSRSDSQRWESNPRPSLYESAAQPTELRWQEGQSSQ